MSVASSNESVLVPGRYTSVKPSPLVMLALCLSVLCCRPLCRFVGVLTWLMFCSVSTENQTVPSSVYTLVQSKHHPEAPTEVIGNVRRAGMSSHMHALEEDVPQTFYYCIITFVPHVHVLFAMSNVGCIAG